jgi:hypothetical protein
MYWRIQGVELDEEPIGPRKNRGETPAAKKPRRIAKALSVDVSWDMLNCQTVGVSVKKRSSVEENVPRAQGEEGRQMLIRAREIWQHAGKKNNINRAFNKARMYVRKKAQCFGLELALATLYKV